MRIQQAPLCKGLRMGWQTLSVKSQIVSILRLAGHMVSVAISQLCPRAQSSHRQYVNEWAQMFQ